MRKYTGKEWALRLTTLFLGAVVTALGVSLFLLTDFGMDPFTMLVNGVHKTFPMISNGLAHFLINMLLLVIIFFTARRYIFVGTLVALTCTGLFVDIWSAVFSPIYSLRTAVAAGWRLVVGTVIVGAGSASLPSPGWGPGRTIWCPSS